MLQMNKILSLIAIISFLALSLSSLALAQPGTMAKKADFVVTKGGESRIVTVWLNKEVMGFSPQGTEQIALWRLWQTEHPSFFQAYPEKQYCIEFDRLTSQEMETTLDELKQLVNGHEFVERVTINGKQFELSSLESGQVVKQTMAEWSDYKTFDYADIGDNEADPVLGQLIQQGFVEVL
ncbi:hypothetical protein TQ33_1277 [Kangiella geojedonensis]|uniref:Uncharacterized protein n=2 Tax=Kangiella geojedonensis TaxID=914150 RepID=A0A0F6TQU7_9GAMM|nr:hypothetical protein TQ33_1277 [Kangiella geojedonensis]